MRIVYTQQGLGTPTASQHNVFDSETLTYFSCAPGADGVRTSDLLDLWLSNPTLPTEPPRLKFHIFTKCQVHIWAKIGHYFKLLLCWPKLRTIWSILGVAISFQPFTIDLDSTETIILHTEYNTHPRWHMNWKWNSRSNTKDKSNDLLEFFFL